MVEMKKVSVKGKNVFVMPEQIEALRFAGHDVEEPSQRKITPAMAETLKKEAEAREAEESAEKKLKKKAVEGEEKKGS